MNTAERSSVHDEAWLLLPWLANGRLSESQREWVQEHVATCDACSAELVTQRTLCEAFSAPDRVTHAPGPSFRKLMERLDDPNAQVPDLDSDGIPIAAAPTPFAPRARPARSSRALWRPPGFAWAASFMLMVGLTVLIATAYRWSEPRYITHTDSVETARPQALHVAFDRGLTIGEVEEMLRANGARVVEGPDSTGIFGIAPADRAGSVPDLAARMRTDRRVRWVEPVTSAAAGAVEGRAPAGRIQ